MLRASGRREARDGGNRFLRLAPFVRTECSSPGHDLTREVMDEAPIPVMDIVLAH